MVEKEEVFTRIEDSRVERIPMTMDREGVIRILRKEDMSRKSIGIAVGTVLISNLNMLKKLSKI